MAGDHFRVKGPLNVSACGETPIPLIQAGQELIPRLSEAGLFRSDYSGATFGGHLRD